MSLADIVPVAASCQMPRRRIGKAAAMRRWQMKNRAHLRRYKRAWRANGGRG